MSVWLDSIKTGLNIYGALALLCFIPLGFAAMAARKKVNAVRFAIGQLTAVYFCCLCALVFLPLPTAAEAANLTYRIQLVPFFFVYDMVKSPSISGVLGVVFNVMLTVPFGCVLRYCCKMDLKKIALAGLALSLFIEVAQLTGLFFLFGGSYRLCDVDDLITNTLGAGLGCMLVSKLSANIPPIEAFDMTIVVRRWGRGAVTHF